VLERAGSREPANRGLAHTVGARQIGLHSAVSEPLEGLLALVGCQLDRAAEFHASGLGALAATLQPPGERPDRPLPLIVEALACPA
jgi:hypothetical protein